MSNWAGKTPTADEWRDILEKHARWTRGAEGGSRANLSRADLSGANLSRAKNADLVIAQTRILPDGDLIGWKKCREGVVVKLRIPAEAKRSHAFGRKCRAEYVDVLEVIGAEYGVSLFDESTQYRVGQRVTPNEWNADWTEECSGGIHFLLRERKRRRGNDFAGSSPRGPGGVRGMRFAYADPPYLGLAAKFYGDRHPDAAAYDRIETHAALIERLSAEFDGWAMSLHSPSLRSILPLCPEDVRVMAWVKPFASFKKGVNPAYAWEPVIVRGVRQHRALTEPTVRDWVSVPITLRRGFQGAKPDVFCFWLFDVLGMAAEDELADLFPGSGAVGRALDSWRRQRRFA